MNSLSISGKTRILFLFAVMLPAALLIVSCSSPPIKSDEGTYVWPLPPDKPKIRYVKSIFGEHDIILPSKADILFGKSATTDLVKPYGVTVDFQGRIYVTDTVRRAVFIFDDFLSQVSFIGLNDTTFRLPADVAVDDRGRIYVSDTGHDEILMFDRDGSFIKRFGKDLLDNPSGMAIDESLDRLYVVSTRTHRVEAFTLEGDHIFGFGGRGGIHGMFNFPRGIAVSNRGDVFVVDSENFRVQVFNSNGAYLRSFGGIGTSPGQFSRPRGIGIDMNDNLYVTDAAFNNFQIFDATGTLLLFVGSTGTGGPGEFSLIADIRVDNRNRIYAVDQLNGRVQVFEIMQ